MRALLALFTVLLVPSAVAARDDGPLVLVVDAPSASLEADALRREVARATGREVVGPSDPRAAHRDLLVVAHASGTRWVIRYHPSATPSSSTTCDVDPDALLTALTHASAALAGRDDADLIDPFVGWDPLRDALALTLMDPFARRAPPAFDPWIGPVDLMDPWQ